MQELCAMWSHIEMLRTPAGLRHASRKPTGTYGNQKHIIADYGQSICSQTSLTLAGEGYNVAKGFKIMASQLLIIDHYWDLKWIMNPILVHF